MGSNPATTKDDVSHYTIPLSEAKAKEWIDALSVTDFSESTRCVFHGLIDFNRRVVPPLIRVRIGERLLPTFNVLINNLQRHLSYRAFPLPQKGQRIFELHQSLLLEFAGLYQLAALDMLTRGEGRKRALQIAIYRVIDYLGQYLLSSYRVYARTRETIWHDLHHMYLLATEHGLDKLAFNTGYKGTQNIETRYIQINMLALFKPYSLRQEEILRVDRYVKDHSDLVSISTEPKEDEVLGDFVHVAILNNDEPAVIMPFGDLPHSPTTRVFNIRRLLVHIDQLIQDAAYENSFALVLPSGLSRNLAKRMIYHLTTVRNRESNRFPHEGKVATVMGMKQVLEAIRNHKDPGADEQREEDLLFDNILYGEYDDINASPPDSTQELSPQLSKNEPNTQIWNAINSSIGGYGLHWEQKESSSARVGELVALRNSVNTQQNWQVGVLKWMECIPKKGLYCGLELLSNEAVSCTIEKVFNRSLRNHLPIQGITLPSIDGIRPHAVLVLPAYIFQPGDELECQIGQQKQQITLTHLDECLGIFGYFHFTSKETQITEEEQEGDFSEIWEVI